MCGSLKLEGQMYQTKMHGTIPSSNIDGANKEFSKDKYRWTGWARIDGSRDRSKTFAEQWPRDKVQIVTIKEVSQFTERDRSTGENVSFNAQGRQIAAIINKDGELKIITRAAEGEEKKIHNRMPVTVKNSMGQKGLVAFIKKKLNVDYEKDSNE